MSSEKKWHLVHSRLQRLQTVEVSKALLESGIENIVLKGAAIERFYPEDEARPSVDLDLAVAPEKYETALQLRNSGQLGNYNIDLHEGLRHFDTRDWDEVLAKTTSFELEEGSVRVLSAEDQLRLICVHWLTDGGERKERLWDIHHVVKGSGGDFDWEYCLNANGPIRRQWIISVLGLAHKCTGLSIEGLPFEDQARDLPDWLVNTLEKRWKDEIRFSPLDSNLANPLLFYRQLLRRFPPNAVMATVALEGKFDEGKRLPYQIRYFLRRMGPSFTRVLKSFFRRLGR